jgi:hypothetical protein
MPDQQDHEEQRSIDLELVKEHFVDAVESSAY